MNNMDDTYKEKNKIAIIGHYSDAFDAGMVASMDDAELTQTPVFQIFAPPTFDFHIPRQKLYGTVVEVRTEAKIGRNLVCPKCTSGLKYKKCCGFRSANQ